MSKQPPDYAVGYGKPPLHSRFRKGISGNLVKVSTNVTGASWATPFCVSPIP